MRPKWVVTTGQKVAYSPLQRKMVVYSLCQAIQSTDFITYPLDVLRDAYNEELYASGIDAHVDACKELRGTFTSELIVDIWVAGESPVDPATVVAILGILKTVAAVIAGILIFSLAATYIERITSTLFPQGKWYTPDGQVFSTPQEYITYMRNVYNPNQGYPYTCPYCGRGFRTQEELDQHIQDCVIRKQG